MIIVNWIIADDTIEKNPEGKKIPEISTQQELKLTQIGNKKFAAIFKTDDFMKFNVESFYNLMKKAYFSIPNETDDVITYILTYGGNTEDAVFKIERLNKLILSNENNFIFQSNISVDEETKNNSIFDSIKEESIESPFDVERKRKKKVSFPSSKLIEKAKKSVKSHNIIISDSKKDIKRDVDVIESFLRKFIPGKEAWIKKYRKDVLQRWVATFVISPKKAKRIKKAHKVAMNLKKSKRDLTKTKSDLFYDITR